MVGDTAAFAASAAFAAQIALTFDGTVRDTEQRDEMTGDLAVVVVVDVDRTTTNLIKKGKTRERGKNELRYVALEEEGSG